MNLRHLAPKASTLAKLSYTSILSLLLFLFSFARPLAKLSPCALSLAMLCFAALPQAPFISHRERALSSPKASTLAKLSYTSVFIFNALIFYNIIECLSSGFLGEYRSAFLIIFLYFIDEERRKMYNNPIVQ